MGLVRTSEEEGGRLARIVLEAPPDNALSLSLLQELEAALDALSRWPDLVCVVLEGAGRDFSTGLSLGERRAPYTAMLLGAWHGCLRRWAALDAVRVAKVRGRCLGAACEATLVCHEVLVDRSARLGFPEIALGAFPTAAPLLLPERVGALRAQELVLSGREVEASEAVTVGLATACSSGWEDLDAMVERRVRQEVLSRSSVAVRAAVRALREAAPPRLEEELAGLERLYLERVAPAHDAEEGISAALRSRPPRWKHG